MDKLNRSGLPGHSASFLKQLGKPDLSWNITDAPFVNWMRFFFLAQLLLTKKLFANWRFQSTVRFPKTTHRKTNLVFDHVSQDIASKNWELGDIILFHLNSYRKDKNAILNYSIIFLKILEEMWASHNVWHHFPIPIRW